MELKKEIIKHGYESADCLNVPQSMSRQGSEIEDLELIQNIEKVALLQRKFFVHSEKIDISAMSLDMQIKVYVSLCQLAKAIDIALAVIDADSPEQEPTFMTEIHVVFINWRNGVSRLLQKLMELGIGGEEGAALIAIHPSD